MEIATKSASRSFTPDFAGNVQSAADKFMVIMHHASQLDCLLAVRHLTGDPLCDLDEAKQKDVKEKYGEQFDKQVFEVERYSVVAKEMGFESNLLTESKGSSFQEVLLRQNIIKALLKKLSSTTQHGYAQVLDAHRHNDDQAEMYRALYACP